MDYKEVYKRVAEDVKMYMDIYTVEEIEDATDLIMELIVEVLEENGFKMNKKLFSKEDIIRAEALFKIFKNYKQNPSMNDGAITELVVDLFRDYIDEYPPSFPPI